MNELLDVRRWPHALLRYPLLILTALLLGALLAFSYSYAPLHRAKDWKIGYLEERLESRNQQLREAGNNLTEARTSLNGTLSRGEVSAIRTQLGEATRLADSRKNEITSLQKRLTQARKTRDQWRNRHATALSEIEAQQQRAVPVITVKPAVETIPAPPAAIAPETPGPSGDTPETVTPIED